jgi:DNA-binding Xre family transcriptional regulator
MIQTLSSVAILPKLPTVKLKVADLMAARGMTAYRLAADSGGRISQRTAYRLANNEKAALYAEEIAALCDILEVTPGDLFEYAPVKPKRGR